VRALVQHPSSGSVRSSPIQVAAYENVWGASTTSVRAWRKAFETNVIGALTSCARWPRHEGGAGARGLIGSQSMFQPALPKAGTPPPKRLLSAMYYLATSSVPDNIRCNMVVPSWMWVLT